MDFIPISKPGSDFQNCALLDVQLHHENMLIYCTTSQVLYVVYMLLTISSLLNSQVKTAAQVNMFVTQLYMLPSMNACPLNLIIYIRDNYCCVQQEYVLIT